MTILRRAASLLVLSIALSACAPTPAPTPSATGKVVPAETMTATPPSRGPSDSVAASANATLHLVPHVVTGKGITVSMPDSWQAVSASELDQTAIDAVIASNPDRAQILKDALAKIKDGSIAFFGFDGASTDPSFTANVNVIASDQAVPADQQQTFADTTAAQIESQFSLAPGAASSRLLTLPAGTAVELRYGLTLNSAAGKPIALDLTQDIIFTPTRTLIVTFTAAHDAAATYDPIFTAMAGTLTVN
jgi:hypothetical protein